MDAGTLEQFELTDHVTFAGHPGAVRPDPDALGRLIGGLREIIEGARTQSLSLQSTIEQASALDGDIAAASRQLHERLSLSARMLKAFQSQIERIEGLLEGSRESEERALALNQRMQSRIDEFETRLERYLERFDARLEEMTSRASKRFKAEIAEHEAALKAAAEGLPAIDGRLIELKDQLTSAESGWIGAQDSLREAIENALEAQSELKMDAERSMEVAANLGEQSRAAAQELEARLRDACVAGRDLEARSARAHTLLPALADLEQVRGRVSQLLSRLEPILPVLTDEERYATARVRHAADLMRTGLRRELKEIAGAFQQLAETGLPVPPTAPAQDRTPLTGAPGPSRPHRGPAVARQVSAPLVEILLPEPAGAD